MKLSVVIPIYNEELNIRPLINKIKADITDFSYEVVFVDDGSTDRTVDEIKQIAPIRFMSHEEILEIQIVHKQE